MRAQLARASLGLPRYKCINVGKACLMFILYSIQACFNNFVGVPEMT